MGIRNFRHDRLERFFHSSDLRVLGKQFGKAKFILDFLDNISSPADCRMLKGFHKLKGRRKNTYAVTATGNFRITFKWRDGDVTDVNLEDYH